MWNSSSHMMGMPMMAAPAPAISADAAVWRTLHELQAQISRLERQVRQLEGDAEWAASKIDDLRHGRGERASTNPDGPPYGAPPQPRYEAPPQPHYEAPSQPRNEATSRTASSSKRSRGESPDREMMQDVAKRPRPHQSGDGALLPSNASSSRRPQIRPGTASSSAGPSGPPDHSNREKSRNDSHSKQARKLQVILVRGDRWKEAPPPAPEPVVVGPNSGWSRVLGLDTYTNSAEKRAYIYLLWGKANKAERDAFVTRLNESMNDSTTEANRDFLFECSLYHSSWSVFKEDVKHDAFFKSAWLVANAWINPIPKAERIAHYKREDYDPIEHVPMEQIIQLAPPAADTFGNDHPDVNAAVMSWVEFSSAHRNKTILRHAGEAPVDDNGNVVTDAATSSLIRKFLIAGEFVCQRFRSNVGNHLLRRKVIRRLRVLFKNPEQARARLAALDLAEYHMVYEPVETTNYWDAGNVVHAAFPLAEDGLFSDDELLRHVIENGNIAAVRALCLLGRNVGPSKGTTWITDAELKAMRSAAVTSLPVDDELATAFGALEIDIPALATASQVEQSTDTPMAE